ncbi:MFS transporter [Arthrobacter sp. CDRTa11]|uniref:MFS transporter n=1 Tax=Arthrobacter sp. CDRTa11 TaxID=2651199 RepID=UPI0022658593|nr:MFS transporter [Arthrobacter sp. CDRTa11]UZX05138.1 MFS transporter [Arthrobacter sp. CDRTa11]
MPPSEQVRHPRLLLFAAVLLTAANLRSTITGVGPLLAQISADLGTTEAALGLLAAIPLIAFALVSPLAHALGMRFGISAVVFCSLIALGAGTVWRSLPGTSLNLWAGTVLTGASLAVANVLLPAVIKREFSDRLAVVTALFTAFLSGTGALASGIVVPVSQIPAGDGVVGWSGALLFSGSLIPLATVVWLAVLMRRRGGEPLPTLGPGTGGPHAVASTAKPEPAPGGRWGVWGDPVAWQVLSYMGFQAMTFYMMVTWLAPLAHSIGRSEVVAGIDVMVLQVSSLAGSLAVPLMLRGRLARWTPAVIPVLGLVAITGLIIAPVLFAGWVILYGLSSGASLAMSFSLFGLRARTSGAAGRLSGMAQSGGYAIAAVGPVAFGSLLSLTGGWLVPLLLVELALAAQLAVGFFVGRERHVMPASSHPSG